MASKKQTSFLTSIKKFFIFLIILFAIFYIGVIIGYSVIGDGDIMDALTFRNLKHIIDIIKT